MGCSGLAWWVVGAARVEIVNAGSFRFIDLCYSVFKNQQGCGGEARFETFGFQSQKPQVLFHMSASLEDHSSKTQERLHND